MKKDIIVNELFQSLFSPEELQVLLEEEKYVDTARKFTAYDLLSYWITAAIERWRSFRHSEKALQGGSYLPHVDHTTLSKKASDVPFTILQAVLHTLIHRCSRSLRRACKLPEEALDSTCITVGKGRLSWASFHGSKAGIKLHVRMDTQTQALCQVEPSLARDHDSSVAGQLLHTPHRIVIQDRAYVDRKRFAQMEKDGVFFVVRLRQSMGGTHTIPEDTPAEVPVSSRHLPSFTRVVSFRDHRGKPVYVITNLRLYTPEMIAQLYQARWKIEIFFRWIKQHLNVTQLFGTSEHAVFGQLFGACIAYVLLHLLSHWQRPPRFKDVSMLNFMRDLSMGTLPSEWAVVVFECLRSFRS